MSTHSLLSAVRKGQASLFLQCAGQGNDWLGELTFAWGTCPLAASLIEDCAKAIEEELAHWPNEKDVYKFDILSWVKGGNVSGEYLDFAPISCPMIMLTQLATFIKLCCQLDLEPSQFCELLKGATGHSQGLITVCVIASSKTMADFCELSRRVIKFMLCQGICAQGRLGTDSSMLLVRCTQEQLTPYLESVNAQLPLSAHAFHSLHNSKSANVVSGSHTTLTKLKAVLDDAKVGNSFMRTTAPFHCPLLADASVSLIAALERLGPLFKGSSLAIPVYDTHTGLDLRQDPNLDETLVKLQLIEPLSWPAALTAVREESITHVVDLGPGNSIARATTNQTNALVMSPFLEFDSLILRQLGPVVYREPVTEKKDTEDRYDTPLEQKIAALWKSVLKINSVSKTDTFYSLGGDSFLAVNVLAQIRETLNASLSLDTLIANPTLAELAKNLAEVKAVEPGEAFPKAKGSHLLSFGQQRLWFLHQVSKSPVYNEALAFDVHARIASDDLRQALSMVINRQDSLRTCYQLDEKNEPCVVLNEESKVEVVEQVCSEEKASEAILPFVNRRFDLERGLPVRCLLLQGKDFTTIVFVFHHIAYDGSSEQVFLRELEECYEAVMQGRSHSHLRPLTYQYTDFASWQREQVSSPDYARQLQYWKEKLEGMKILELPTDFPRPPRVTFDGACEVFVLSPRTAESLKLVCRQLNCTLFTCLLTVFKVLLHRWSGSFDLTIGAASANRPPDLGSIIGFFVETMVLRTVFEEKDFSFADAVSRVEATTVEYFRNRSVTFDALAQFAQNDPSRNPLVQVAFTLQNYERRGLCLGGSSERHEILPTCAKFDLSLFFEPQPDGTILGRFEYNTNLFLQSSVSRMVGHINQILDGIITNPSISIATVPLLTPQEYELVVNTWNSGNKLSVPAICYHDLFVANTKKHGDNLAIIDGSTSFTFKELDRFTNQLGQVLLRQGVQAKARVVLAMDRSWEYIASLLAVLKLGAVYVPVAEDHIEAKIEHFFDDAGATVVLCRSRAREKLTKYERVTVMFIDELKESISKEENVEHKVEMGPEDLAYIIYTSGSTGKPKGACLKHGNLVNLIFAQESMYRMKPTDRSAWSLSTSFDGSMFEYMTPLIVGGCIVVVPDQTRLSVELLTQFCLDNGITILGLTTALWNLVHSRGDWSTNKQLRIAWVGGERLLEGPAPSCPFEFWNIYGPTECTIGMTGALVPPACKHPNVGKPMANTTCYILDAHLQPVPIGVPGELCIGGAQVGWGYLNRPDTNAEKFLPNPFHPGRMYRSGDVCKWLPNGDIDYVGRTDFQVKIRGYRIELGEIESVITKFEGVQECVVLALDHGTTKRLAAYVKPSPGVQLQSAEIIKFVGQHLAAYMVPSAVVVMPKFPMTVNNKCDRRALPVPDWTEGEGEFVVPVSAVDQAVVDVVRDVLQLQGEQLGMQSDIFRLGASSLTLLRILNTLKAKFGVMVAVDDVRDNPTLAALSGLITGGEQSALEALPPPVNFLAGSPLSPPQEGLYVLHQMNPQSAAYNIPFAYRIRGVVHASRIQKALELVCARHVILRCMFSEKNDKPIQTPNMSLPLVFRKMKCNADDLPSLLSRMANEGFDITSTLPVRCAVIQLDSTDYVLFICFHHIVTDGLSSGIFFKELWAFYDSPGTILPPLSNSYADFVRWANASYDTPEYKEKMTYWLGKLNSLKTLEMPTDHKRPPSVTSNGDHYNFVIRPEIADMVQKTANSLSCTIYELLLTIFKVLLHRYSGQSDIVIGSVFDNRGRHEFENIIGYFVTSIVLRSDFEGDPTFAEAVTRVRRTASEAIKNGGVPLNKLVKELAPERDRSRNPLFQIMFTYVDFVKDEHPKAFQVKPEPFEWKTSKMDLTLTFTWGNGLKGTLEYNTDLFLPETIQAMAGHTECLLESCLRDPSGRISVLPMMTQKERNLVVEGWNQTDLKVDDSLCYHDLVMNSVQKFPDKLCMVDPVRDVQLTYTMLEARTRQLAHLLLSRGLKVEGRVVVAMDRSWCYQVAYISVMRAGGCMIPVAQEHVLAKMNYFLEDAQPLLVLSYAALEDELIKYQDRVEVIYVDELQWTDSPPLPPTGVVSDNLAYMIYTSGSTGKPKGTMLTHKNLVNMVCAEVEVFKITPEDRWSFVGCTSFDGCMFNYMPPPCTGGTLYVGSDSVRLTAELCDFTLKYEITIVGLVTALWNLVHSASDWSKHTKLRIVWAGGERLLQGPSRSCPFQFWNAYGPTETCITSSVALVPPEDKHPNVGKPMGNTRYYVLDQHLQPVPAGVPGELCIAGAQVARGYLNRPDITAQRFILDPFDPTGKRRMYRTGDVCRWLRDGSMEYVGRSDFQVKIRGYRVELGEIEACITQFDGVQECVVKAFDVGVTKKLVAYVNPKHGRQPDPADITKHCNDNLAAYMVPNAIVIMEQFPLTVNGKCDRAALQMPEMAAATIAPVSDGRDRSTTEKKLCVLVASILGIQDVSPDQDMFELGLDSLQAAELASKIRTTLGAGISLRELFEHPKISSLALVIAPNSEAEHEEVAEEEVAVRTIGCCSLSMAFVIQLVGFIFWWLLSFVCAAPGLIAINLIYFEYGLAYALLFPPGFFLLNGLTQLVIVLFLKRLVLWRHTPGDYPVYSLYYFRWWFVDQLMTSTLPITHALRGTIFLNWWFRLLGADIGPDARLYSNRLGSVDLIRIGDHTLLSEKACIVGHVIVDGILKLRPVEVGWKCLIGVQAAVLPDVVIGDQVYIGPLSVVPVGSVLPALSTWQGSPLREREGEVSITPPISCCETLFHLLGFLVLAIVAGIAVIPGLVSLVTVVPIDDWNNHTEFAIFKFLLLSYPLSLLGFLSYLVLALPLKWVILGRREPNQCHPVDSFPALRIWLHGLLMEAPLMQGAAYLISETVIVSWVGRFLGGSLGKGTRIPCSAATLCNIDMLRLGPNASLGALCSILGSVVEGDTVRSDWMTLGEGSFIGALSVVMPGSELGDSTIIGSLSLVDGNYPSNSLYIGSPPVCLRQGEPAPAAAATEDRPVPCIGLTQLTMLLGKILLPTGTMAGMLVGTEKLTNYILTTFDLPIAPATVAVMVPSCILVSSFALLLIVFTIKHCLITFEQSVNRMWGWTYLRMTLLQSLVFLCDAWVLQGLRGTPIYSTFFWLMGSKVGKRVYVNCPPPTEFEMIEIGDDVCLADGVALLGHTIDGGAVEYKPIRLEDRCSVGFNTVLLPGVTMLTASRMGPFSLGMKNEVFPKNSHWQGSPAVMSTKGGKGNLQSVLANTMARDIHFDKSAAAGKRVMMFNPQYERVFLTGATGFYGAFLLAELLKNRKVTVWCLVRANDVEEGANRLKAALAQYKRTVPHFKKQVEVVIGDLDQPRFGLSPDAFLDLANKIDVIIHNGAYVNGALPYSKLAPANVEGTRTCLDLATVGNSIKHLHYVSTLSVFAHDVKEQSEDAIPRSSRGLDSGYAQSKYVAEKIVLLARDAGLPVTIYRLGRVTGDSVNGAGSVNDFAFLFIKGCIEVARVPEPAPFEIDLIPADYCARALVELSRLPQCIGAVYHLANDKPVSMSRFFNVFREKGYRLQKREFNKWRATLRQAEGNAFLPLIDALDEAHGQTTRISCTRARTALRTECNVDLCPEVNDTLIHVYVEFFLSTSYIAPKTQLKLFGSVLNPWSKTDASSQTGLNQPLLRQNSEVSGFGSRNSRMRYVKGESSGSRGNLIRTKSVESKKAPVRIPTPTKSSLGSSLGRQSNSSLNFTPSPKGKSPLKFLEGKKSDRRSNKAKELRQLLDPDSDSEMKDDLEY